MFRAITPEDIDELAALVADAFRDYRWFAPAGWQPPRAAAQVDVLHRWIEEPEFWGELASAEQTLIGHATFIPASRLFVPEGQARPRRCYEREQFVAVGEPFDPCLGLPVREYRRSLMAAQATD